MRRPAITCVVVLSLGALTFAASACATSPSDDLGEAPAAANVSPTEPGVKLPAPSNNQDGGTDSASPVDAAKPDTSTSSSSSSSGSTSSSSSSSSSSTSSSGGTGAACNIGDPLKLVLYQYQVTQQTTPVPCPCAASKCCYLGVTCLNP